MKPKGTFKIVTFSHFIDKRGCRKGSSVPRPLSGRPVSLSVIPDERILCAVPCPFSPRCLDWLTVRCGSLTRWKLHPESVLGVRFHGREEGLCLSCPQSI